MTNDTTTRRAGGATTYEDVKASRERRGLRQFNVDMPVEAFENGTTDTLKRLVAALRAGEVTHLRMGLRTSTL